MLCGGAGLFRVRGFTQDDAHIFCLPEQIAGEIVGVLALVEEVMGAFGFQEFEVRRAALDMCAAISASVHGVFRVCSMGALGL